MGDLLTSNGHLDTFDDSSPSMQPYFPPEMAGDGTVLWEDFYQLNNPDPNPEDDYWISAEQYKELAGKDELFPIANDSKDDPPYGQNNVDITVDKQSMPIRLEASQDRNQDALLDLEETKSSI